MAFSGAPGPPQRARGTGPGFRNSTKLFLLKTTKVNQILTRSSWLNSALRDDEAVYWVSIGHYEAVAVRN